MRNIKPTGKPGKVLALLYSAHKTAREVQKDLCLTKAQKANALLSNLKSAHLVCISGYVPDTDMGSQGSNRAFFCGGKPQLKVFTCTARGRALVDLWK